MESTTTENGATITKRERFEKAASLRTSNAIQAIRQLRKCTSSNYEYTAADWNQIMGALAEELNGLKMDVEKALRPKPPKGEKSEKGPRELLFRL